MHIHKRGLIIYVSGVDFHEGGLYLGGTLFRENFKGVTFIASKFYPPPYGSTFPENFFFI